MEYPRLKRSESQSSAATHTTTPVSEPQPEPVRFTPSTPHRSSKSDRPRSKKLLVVALLAVILLLVGGWYLLQGNKGSAAGYIDNNKYQAVLFTNGQIYFGKLKIVDDEFMKLSDVFYVQAQDKQTNETTQEKPNNNMELIKLGKNEIYGPDDEVIFSRDQMLYFQNIQADGKVSKGIEEYKKTQDR